ncbi:MAG: HAD hydrolase-like protein, partial [Gammaproteobacteria bacterium]
NEGCSCRKPRPGLIEAVLARSGLPSESALLIGDRETDLMAARAAGIQAVLVSTGHGATATSRTELSSPVYKDLAAAIAALCIAIH